MIEMNFDKMIHLIENVFGIYSVYCFFAYFLIKRKISIKYFFLSYFIYFLALGISYLYYDNILINMFVSLMGIFALTFLYLSNFSRRVLATVLFYIIAMISEISVSFTFSIINNVELAILFQNNNSKLLMNGCSVIFLFMLVKLIACWMRKSNEVKLPMLYWLAVFTIPTGSMFLLHVIFSYAIFYTRFEFHASTIMAVAVVIIINCLVFYLYDKLLMDAITRTQNTLLEQQVLYYTKQYEETEAMQKEVSSIRHDIKNQLMGIQGYVKENDYDGLDHYLDALLGKINRTKQSIYSGNAKIDSILYNKISCAKKEEIPVELDLKIPPSLKIDPNNLFIIIGNTLDNAIEACCKLNKNERKIFIIMRYEQGALYFNIKNPYKESLIFDSHGELSSSKKQNKNHGIGIRNIKNIIEKEEYFMKIDSDDHVFKLQIIFFEKQ